MVIIPNKLEIEWVVPKQVIDIVALETEILEAKQALVGLIYCDEPVGLRGGCVETLVMSLITDSSHILEAITALLNHGRVLEDVFVF